MFWPKRWRCPYGWWSLLAWIITLLKKKVRLRRTLPQRRWRRRRRRRQTKIDAELFKETKPFALTCSSTPAATQTVIIMSQRRLNGCTMFCNACCTLPGICRPISLACVTAGCRWCFSGAKNPPEVLHYMTIYQLSSKLTVEFFVDTNMQSDNNT